MKKHKYTLASMIEKQQVGADFEKFPLHITIIPWFEAANEAELIEKLDALYSSMQSFLYLGGERDMFGPKNNIPVFKVKNNSPMRTLHTQTMNVLDGIGAKTDDQYVGDNYFAHITVQDKSINLENVQFKLDSVDLVVSVKEWPKKVRRSVTRFDLKS